MLWWLIGTGAVCFAAGASGAYGWVSWSMRQESAELRAELAEALAIIGRQNRAESGSESVCERLERLAGTSEPADRAGAAGDGPRPAEPVSGPPVQRQSVGSWWAGGGDMYPDPGPTERELQDWAIHQDHAGDGEADR